MAEKKIIEYVCVGRRKTAVVSVRLRPAGQGKVDVNGRTLEEFFPSQLHRNLITAPFSEEYPAAQYDMIVRVKGGGNSAQATALQLALSRALVAENEARRQDLKTQGFLTRDPRKKERKKYGLAGARKQFQFSKR